MPFSMPTFRLKIHQRTSLIQIVESGYYPCIILGEPVEHCLFCLVCEKNIYSLSYLKITYLRKTIEKFSGIHYLPFQFFIFIFSA